MLTYESSKVSISALPPRKFPRTKMLNLGGLRYRVLDGLDEDGHLRCGQHYVSAASSMWSSTANTATTTALVERTLWPQGHLLVLTSLQRTLSSCGP